MTKVTFLGTGTSQGVPMIGCSCKVCTSNDPKDRRLRSSVLVEHEGLSILVDCGPDFRYQMLRAGVRHLDAILLTHNHLDHTGGLDDTRSFNYIESRPMNIYCQEYVENSLRRQYAYAFAEPKYPGSPEWHIHRIGNEAFRVFSNENEDILSWESGVGYHCSKSESYQDGTSVEVIPIQGWHDSDRKVSVLGYRFGKFAYLTDMKVIDDCELEKLKGLDAVTLNCVKRGSHHSHFSLGEAIEFFEKVGAKDSYITHISHRLPVYEELERELPPHIHQAYDGLVLKF